MRNALSLLRIENERRSVRRLHAATLLAAALTSSLLAQPPNNANNPNNAANALVVPGGQQNAALFGPALGAGGEGGAANADFDSLIDLITSTVHPEMWADNGGVGDVRPFFGGVLVDSAAATEQYTRVTDQPDAARRRGAVPALSSASAADARTASSLRCISLPRLEREIARRQATKQPLGEAMLTLAGLQRVRYVFVYPETGDLVVAGPAGDWRVERTRLVSVDTGQPVVRLDDLLVLLRRGQHSAASFFGCSINPRREALAATQQFLFASSQRPLEPGQRKEWLGELRDSVGRQDIEIFGIDPASRVAGVLVEADYHMKLIGIGLAEGIGGVESYLDSMQLAAGDAPPPMSVLRWWFTLAYDSIAASKEGVAFELVGSGVRVLSENELLAAQGQRVHTDQSEPLNRQFAQNFTEHFAELAAKYPVYGELRNVFDLAMAVALIHEEKLMARAGWTARLLVDTERLRLPQGIVPREVETVINHRLVNRRHIIAGVSGGVMVAPGDVLSAKRAPQAGLGDQHQATAPTQAAAGAWWWDAAPPGTAAPGE